MSDIPAIGTLLKNNFADGTGLCQLRADWLNKVADFVMSLDIQLLDGITDPFIDRSSTNPAEWIIYIPSSLLPDPPDETNSYVLMSVAGVVQWVRTAEFTCPV